MTRDSPAITPRGILFLWLPMASTWVMMALEVPFLAALIARLDEPKFNLAAFGVAYAMAILVEAPVIMILSASTALVDGPTTLHKLRRFSQALNLAVTVMIPLLALTPAWNLLALRGIGLAPEVAELTRVALLILTPWPAAIGYRRFYQGLLIRSGRTRLVAYGTVVRLIGMIVVGGLLYRMTSLPGAWIGAATISSAVLIEAVVARLMTLPEVRRVQAQTNVESGEGLSYRGIARFYWPLALTSLIGLTAQPMITFFIGHARFPLESLAVIPVVHALSFLFRALGLAYQEVAISLLARGRDHFGPVLRFSVGLALLASAGQALVAFTPLADLWFGRLSALTPELIGFALPAAQILALVPALSVMQATQRAMLVHARSTGAISRGTAIEVVCILAALLLTVRGFALIGATAAALSFLIGRVAGNVFLIPSCVRAVKQNET